MMLCIYHKYTFVKLIFKQQRVSTTKPSQKPFSKWNTKKKSTKNCILYVFGVFVNYRIKWKKTKTKRKTLARLNVAEFACWKLIPSDRLSCRFRSSTYWQLLESISCTLFTKCLQHPSVQLIQRTLLMPLFSLMLTGCFLMLCRFWTLFSLFWGLNFFSHILFLCIQAATESIFNIQTWKVTHTHKQNNEAFILYECSTQSGQIKMLFKPTDC